MYFEFPGTNTRLMGSLHAFPGNVKDMPQWARAAYDWCEVLVIESDPPTLLPFTHSKTPNRLQDSLSPECWSYLSGIWRDSSVLPPIADVTPWAAVLFASMFVLQHSPGVETQFTQWATRDSKPIQALEGAVEIAASFETAPYEDLCKALEMLPTELPLAQTKVETLYEAWAAHDLESFELVANSAPMMQIPSIREAVLKIRNRAWATKIRNSINAQYRTLISVGALHLVGSGNLIECIGVDAVPVT